MEWHFQTRACKGHVGSQLSRYSEDSSLLSVDAAVDTKPSPMTTVYTVRRATCAKSWVHLDGTQAIAPSAHNEPTRSAADGTLDSFTMG